MRRPATGASALRIAESPAAQPSQNSSLSTAIGGTPTTTGSKPGAVTRLTPNVRRLTAANPGYMTGPGTNSYLVGSGGDIAADRSGSARG